jgi:phosphate transport system substrate-binding protein
VNITKSRASLVGGLLALSLAAVACGGDNKNDSGSSTTTATGAATTTGGSTATTGGKVSGTIQGSGSTFQAAYQDEALKDFQDNNKGTTITYGGGGSGKGRTDLKGKTVDFAGSDSPYADADKPADPVLYFPILLGPITVSYNVDGADGLQLSAETIAKIFQRDIKTWNDPAIAADNPDAKLPSTPIIVAHRSDGSGTTDNFTKYLDAAATGVWKLKSGSTVEWPADTQAGSGNAGVAQIIKDNKGAIGYVDLSDATATGLKFASVKNKAGKYVEPSADSASAAGDGITVKPDLTFAAINADGEKSYPITYQTWVIVYQKQADGAKGALLKAYLNYLLTDGQKTLADLDFAPLPKSIQDKAVAQLAQIQVG